MGDSLAGPGVLKASDIQYGILQFLYTPKAWPAVAEGEVLILFRNCRPIIEAPCAAIVELERGIGSTAYSALYSGFYNIQPKPYDEVSH